ncbi:MAG: PLP-dependent transferase, partial [Verrucomicrobiota bacterium]
DNTLATPYLCRPLEHGADIVVNSTTKFLTGNGTSIGGVVTDSGKFDWAASGKYPSLAGPSPEYHGVNFAEACGPLAYTFYNHAIGLRDLGACQSPQNAFHTLLGIETLPLRMDKHCANAVAVARHLEGHEKVAWVSYVGLESSQYQPLVKKYLPKGAGAVFTFGLKGGYDAGISLIKNVELFSLLANVGDIRSLIIHPASTTHRQVPEEQLPLVGAGPEVVRLSVGCEDLDDIIADLDQALDRI